MASKLIVLGYHRVMDPGDASEPDPGVVSATPATFDCQMRYLAERYHVVSLSDVLAAQRGESSLPNDAVLLTFDDACRDFADIAWPILSQYGLPAAVFVPTAYAGAPRRSFWWDRLHRAIGHTTQTELVVPGLRRFSLAGAPARRAALRAVQRHIKTTPHQRAVDLVDALCRQLDVEDDSNAPVLPWAELRALAASGVTLVAHTRSHPVLTQVDDDTIRAEVAGSLQDLAREAASTLPVFCYPYGIHDDRVVRIVREIGVELAFTCEDGHNWLPAKNPLRCRRTSITSRTSPLIFALRLRTAVTYLDRLRHAV